MENNLFTDEQIEYLYSDSRFLSFVNKYFSSFSTYVQDLNYSLEKDKVDDLDVEIYLRIILANVENLQELIADLEDYLSMSQVSYEKDYVGEIQGKLNVNRYTKKMAQRTYPKEYPCVIKKKTYLTPENIYVIFIIKNLLRMLDGFRGFLRNKPNSLSYSELVLIEEHSNAFMMFSKKAYFIECQKSADQFIKSYGEVFPEEQIGLINNRIRKQKIRNYQIYEKIFDWYETFASGSILEAGGSKIRLLRYSQDFSNRLFELWCLYNIKESFVLSFNATVIDENDILDASAKNEYVFKLAVPTGGFLEIFYQKGAELYWHDESDLMWKYKKGNTEKGLRGIPDITIHYQAKEDALIMLDIKNRVRASGANSEEIYKMIGYFSNFKKTFTEYYSQNVKKQGALIFRNDNCANDEMLESDDGYRLMTISAGINANSEINTDQFKKLCKYVLDVQGIDGTASELMGDFASTQKGMANQLDVNSDEYMHELGNRNHSMIEQIFSYGELKERLPQYSLQLRDNHFPHIWDSLSTKTRDILAMAECLYSGVNECETADYAPICLEYCRALEVEMNELIFIPFKNGVDIDVLARRNRFYEKLKEGREMTLGECIYLLDKCNHRNYPLTDLHRFLQRNIKQNTVLLGTAIDFMRGINERVRRLSAHTTVMSYQDLVMTRQLLLGIGNMNVFYVLRDSR